MGALKQTMRVRAAKTKVTNFPSQNTRSKTQDKKQKKYQQGQGQYQLGAHAESHQFD